MKTSVDPIAESGSRADVPGTELLEENAVPMGNAVPPLEFMGPCPQENKSYTQAHLRANQVN